MSDISLRIFVKNIMIKYGNLSYEFADEILESNIILFKQSFTHSSVDEKFNYEFLEFLGDKKVNAYTPQYIMKIKKDHEEIDASLLTIISHRIKGRDVFKKISETLELPSQLKIKKDIVVNEKEFKKVISDLYESFIGAYFMSFENYLKLNKTLTREEIISVAFHYTSIFLENTLKLVDITFNADENIDYITKLKEIYEGFGWKPYMQIKNRRVENIFDYLFELNVKLEGTKKIFEFKIFLYLDDDSEVANLNESKKRVKRVFLASGFDGDNRKAKYLAHEKALEILEKKYKISFKK